MHQTVVILDKPGKKRVVVRFAKKGEEREVIGVVLGRKPGKYELEVLVDHKVGQTFGRVIIRGIAQNGAQVEVTGRIVIAKKAQGVDDFLEMKLLLLDNKSWATAEPELEIEANEVKASHAATVGQIDKEQLFYLMSRGLTKKTSETMLVDGFLRQATDRIEKGGKNARR